MPKLDWRSIAKKYDDDEPKFKLPPPVSEMDLPSMGDMPVVENAPQSSIPQLREDFIPPAPPRPPGLYATPESEPYFKPQDPRAFRGDEPYAADDILGGAWEARRGANQASANILNTLIDFDPTNPFGALPTHEPRAPLDRLNELLYKGTQAVGIRDEGPAPETAVSDFMKNLLGTPGALQEEPTLFAKRHEAPILETSEGKEILPSAGNLAYMTGEYAPEIAATAYGAGPLAKATTASVLGRKFPRLAPKVVESLSRAGATSAGAAAGGLAKGDPEEAAVNAILFPAMELGFEGAIANVAGLPKDISAVAGKVRDLAKSFTKKWKGVPAESLSPRQKTRWLRDVVSFDESAKAYRAQMGDDLVPGLRTFQKLAEERGSISKKPVKPVGVVIPEEQIIGDLSANQVKTGKPIDFEYAKNLEKAPDFGKRFAQDIEPSGEYIIATAKENIPTGWESGRMSFKNPLVIEWKSTGHGGWKTEISKQYNGKKGKALADAIKADGYDGIITISSKTNTVDEVVNLVGQKRGIGAVIPEEQIKPLKPGQVADDLAQGRTMKQAEDLSGTYIEKTAEHLTPEEKVVSEGMFKREAKSIAESRRYKRTWDMVDDEVGKFDAQVNWEKGEIFIKGKKVQKGQPLDDTASEIMGRILRRTEKDLEKAATAYENNPTSTAAKTAFDEALQQTAVVTNRFYGARAEAGRSLNILKKIKQPGDIYERKIMQFMKELPDEKKDAVLTRILEARREMKRLLAKGKSPQEAAVPLQKVMRDFTDASFGDKFAEFVTMVKLTAPTTHARNIIGNVAFAVSKPIERAFAATADLPGAALRKIRGKGGREVFFGEAPAEAFGQSMAVKAAFKEAWIALKTGIYAGTKGQEVALYRPAIKGITGEIVRTPGRLLGAGDAFFKPIARNGVLWAEAYRAAAKKGIRPGSGKFTQFIQDFVKNPATEVSEKMQSEALTRLFQAPMTGLTKTLGRVRMKHPISRVLFALFYNTPINIMKETTKRSPAGILMPTVRADLKAGGARAAEAMGRITMGSAFIASVAAAAESGMIDITPPYDPKEPRGARFMTGKPPSSIKIGDTWYNYGNIEPISTPLVWAATAVQAWRQKDYKTASQTVMKFVSNTYRNMKDTTYLQGLADTIDAIDDPDTAARFFSNAVGLPIPTILGHTARAIDPTIRERRTIGQSLARQVPGLSEEVLPQRNPFGEEIKYEGAPTAESAAGRVAQSFTTQVPRSLFRPTGEEKDPVRLQLREVYDETGYVITKPPRSYRSIKLTPREYDEFSKNVGQEVKDWVYNLVEDEEPITLGQRKESLYWSDMDPDQKEAALKKIVRKSREEYRAEDDDGFTFFDRVVEDRLKGFTLERDKEAFLKGLHRKNHMKRADLDDWLDELEEGAI